jgi:preprotein translocase SecF subunit
MFFRRLNWNVVGWFRTVSLISYIIIGLGVVSLFWHATHAPGGGFQPSHALRLGLSFTGGTDVTVKFKEPQTTDAIAQKFASIGVNDARVSTLGKAGDAQPNERFSIETQTDFGDDTQKLWAAVGSLPGGVDRSQSSVSAVGPSLGREYLIKALEALVIAIGIQFFFIAFRFGWNYIFGLVVVIALVRDAAMMIGIYALADKRADDAFLAAVLTVIGYSVMDTIVILDRIRENVRVMNGQPYDRIVNTSILQTMTRSFNTLATVVVTLVALLAFGGASLQNFAFALLVGICSGGYHSIFYSAPLVNVLRERQLKVATERRDTARIAALTGTDKPRTVAEARAQAERANGLSREDVVAARKERRKKTAVRTTTGPARYKRRRPEPGSPAAAADAAAGYTAADYDEEYAEDPDAHEFIEHEHEHEAHEHDVHDRAVVDPLDAQRAGHHDEAFELGHEEITLNLDGVEPEADPAEHPATAKHE